jgi:hypothetical protein
MTRRSQELFRINGPPLITPPSLSHSSALSHLPTLLDSNIHERSILPPFIPTRPRPLDLPHNFHPFYHPSKNNMLSIQERRRCTRNKELTTIRVGARIRHT